MDLHTATCHAAAATMSEAVGSSRTPRAEASRLPSERRDWRTWSACAAALVTFWAMRIGYWSVTTEEPFSDMAGFREMAERFAAGGKLAVDEFWQSYRAPVLPLLGALQIVLFGDGLGPWRYMQAALVCGGACWLARELWHATGSRWLGSTWLWVTALTQPSVFWSLKFAKEGLHEALSYVVLAAALRLLRRPSLGLAMVVGALTYAAMLNRTNFVLALAVIPALMVFGRAIPGGLAARLRDAAPWLLAFFAGAVLAWLPWGVRTWHLYGRPLAMTTDGSCVALDGLGSIDVLESDGTRQTIEYWPFMHSAPQRFPTDHAADVWLSARVWQAVLADKTRWLHKAVRNVATSAFLREISLTRVPRDRLLPAPWQWLLLDKNAVAVVVGIVGVFLLACWHRRLLVIGLLTVLPWLLACCLLGLPRYLEPAIPLLLFGNVIALATVVPRAVGLLLGWHARRARV